MLKEIHEMLKEIKRMLEQGSQDDFMRNVAANLVAGELERQRKEINLLK